MKQPWLIEQPRVTRIINNCRFFIITEDIQQIYDDPDFGPISSPILDSFGDLEPKFNPGKTLDNHRPGGRLSTIDHLKVICFVKRETIFSI
jgi:hypothetical protein